MPPFFHVTPYGEQIARDQRQAWEQGVFNTGVMVTGSGIIITNYFPAASPIVVPAVGAIDGLLTLLAIPFSKTVEAPENDCRG